MVYFIYANNKLFATCNNFKRALNKIDNITNTYIIQIYENKKEIMWFKKVGENDKYKI